jgi:hypothetical protein
MNRLQKELKTFDSSGINIIDECKRKAAKGIIKLRNP